MHEVENRRVAGAAVHTARATIANPVDAMAAESHGRGHSLLSFTVCGISESRSLPQLASLVKGYDRS